VTVQLCITGFYIYYLVVLLHIIIQIIVAGRHRPAAKHPPNRSLILPPQHSRWRKQNGKSHRSQ